MDSIRLYVQLTEPMAARWQATRALSSGQTMTEYALILAAVGVVVVSGYKAMGTKITSLLTAIDNQL